MKRTGFCLVLLSLIVFLSAEEIETALQAAEEAFAGGDYWREINPELARQYYTEAAGYYEELIRDGYRNGPVYYNLGNAWFRAGDAGYARLAYLRSRLYMPNHEDLNHNLAYLRKIHPNRFEESERSILIDILFFWHRSISRSLRLWITVSAAALFWLFLTLRILKSRRFLVPALAALIPALLFGASLVWEGIASRRHPAGVLIAEETIVRMGDSYTYGSVFSEAMLAGCEFVRLEEREGWWKIRFPDDTEGWIPMERGELINRFAD